MHLTRFSCEQIGGTPRFEAGCPVKVLRRIRRADDAQAVRQHPSRQLYWINGAHDTNR